MALTFLVLGLDMVDSHLSLRELDVWQRVSAVPPLTLFCASHDRSFGLAATSICLESTVGHRMMSSFEFSSSGFLKAHWHDLLLGRFDANWLVLEPISQVELLLVKA